MRAPRRPVITAAAAALAASLLVGGLVHAQAPAPTPAGLWKTIDDDTRREKSQVRIVESGGVYSARVEKILEADSSKGATCKDCTDERKDQPIVGMVIMRGVKASVDDPTRYEGGDILDPGNGKTYRVRLRLVDGGTKLDVRGYIGTPLLGRTQTWIRVE